MKHRVSSTHKISRRSLIERAATLAGVVVTASASMGSNTAFAQGKVPKQQAQYQDKPKGEHHCSGCINFMPPSSCRIVEGQVSPNGWCRFFSPKSQK